MRTKRNSLIDERCNGIGKKHMSFIKTVQERAAKLQTGLAPSLPNDMIFQIFLYLPIKSVLRFSCVCKVWYKLIHCAEFVSAYNSHAQTTPIILREIYEERPRTFHVESQLDLSKNFSLFPLNLWSRRQSKFINFLEIENEKGKLVDLNMSCYGSVVSSCNGLVLIASMHEALGRNMNSSLDQPLIICKENPGQLIVMNPMTRKLIGFPLGTLPFKHGDESYGLVFSHSRGVYKIVHLFKDKAGYIGCEILSLQTRLWKAVEGPVGALFRHFGHAPIPTVEALHWLLGSFGYDYILSMNTDTEKFSMTDLPMTMGIYDRVVEMGGFLSFVNGLNKDHIEVWILKGLNGTKWVKQNTIHIGASLGNLNYEHGIVEFLDDEDFAYVVDDVNVELVNGDDEEHGNLEFVAIEDNEGHVHLDNEENANVVDDANVELVDGDNEEHDILDNEENDDEGNVEHVHLDNEFNEADIFDMFLDDEEYSLSCFALNAKEMVFRRTEKLYAYDFELEEIREIRMGCGEITAYDTIMPHANNLATWEPLEFMS